MIWLPIELLTTSKFSPILNRFFKLYWVIKTVCGRELTVNKDKIKAEICNRIKYIETDIIPLWYNELGIYMILQLILNFLSNDKILQLSILKAFPDDNKMCNHRNRTFSWWK